MNKFLYEPTLYTGYRPQYPESLFQYLNTLIGDNGKVLECGAGSGQGTQGLSRLIYFKYYGGKDGGY